MQPITGESAGTIPDEHAHLLDACSTMRHCHVRRLEGRSVCYELIEESTGAFLLSCTVATDGTGPLLFSSIRDCHLRAFKDLQLVLSRSPNLICEMSRDWLTGMLFVAKSSSKQTICEIK